MVQITRCYGCYAKKPGRLSERSILSKLFFVEPTSLYTPIFAESSESFQSKE